jgi:hypothetical protein
LPVGLELVVGTIGCVLTKAPCVFLLESCSLPTTRPPPPPPAVFEIFRQEGVQVHSFPPAVLSARAVWFVRATGALASHVQNPLPTSMCTKKLQRGSAPPCGPAPHPPHPHTLPTWHLFALAAAGTSNPGEFVAALRRRGEAASVRAQGVLQVDVFLMATSPAAPTRTNRDSKPSPSPHPPTRALKLKVPWTVWAVRGLRGRGDGRGGGCRVCMGGGCAVTSDKYVVSCCRTGARRHPRPRPQHPRTVPLSCPVLRPPASFKVQGPPASVDPIMGPQSQPQQPRAGFRCTQWLRTGPACSGQSHLSYMGRKTIICNFATKFVNTW